MSNDSEIDMDIREKLLVLLNLLLKEKASYLDLLNFQDGMPKDRAVFQIWGVFAENLADDLYPENKIVLNLEWKLMVENSIYFLRVSGNYRWADYPFPKFGFFTTLIVLSSWLFFTQMFVEKENVVAIACLGALIILLGSGFSLSFMAKWSLNKWWGQINKACWPFFTKEELEKAKLISVFLK
jgi:hypothetical protein